MTRHHLWQANLVLALTPEEAAAIESDKVPDSVRNQTISDSSFADIFCRSCGVGLGGTAHGADHPDCPGEGAGS